MGRAFKGVRSDSVGKQNKTANEDLPDIPIVEDLPASVVVTEDVTIGLDFYDDAPTQVEYFLVNNIGEIESSIGSSVVAGSVAPFFPIVWTVPETLGAALIMARATYPTVNMLSNSISTIIRNPVQSTLALSTNTVSQLGSVVMSLSGVEGNPTEVTYQLLDASMVYIEDVGSSTLGPTYQDTWIVPVDRPSGSYFIRALVTYGSTLIYSTLEALTII